MAERAYGQFCGFSRALEVIGERWALLIVRDLLISPKRFTDLHRGLVGIPTNILTARLKELEANGVVRRAVLPRPAGSIVYEMTDSGRELEKVVDAIGCWGARRLDAPREGEVITPDSMATALRSTFQPEAAANVKATVELHMGEIVVHAHIDKGHITVGTGVATKPDLTIEAGPGIKDVMSGAIKPRDAISQGLAHVSGNTKLFDRFGELFRI